LIPWRDEPFQVLLALSLNESLNIDRGVDLERSFGAEATLRNCFFAELHSAEISGNTTNAPAPDTAR